MMKKRIIKLLFIFILLIFSLNIFAQKKQLIVKIPLYTNVIKYDNGFFTNGIIVDGDTLPYVKLYRVIIYPERKFRSKRQYRRYTRLMYNVKKVYPYAVLIGNFYYQIEQDLEHIPEGAQKKYLKRKEKELRDEYEETLINLTFTQGRLLIKLVDRETSKTTYEVIQQFKGDMSAIFWQSLARVFGTNLKTEYKAKEEDQMIEEIIAKIENGQI